MHLPTIGGEHRAPDLMHLPAINGEHCTGDGIKRGEVIGDKSIGLEWVYVHSTGLVKPDDTDAKCESLTAEALQGVGGLVVLGALAHDRRRASRRGRHQDECSRLQRPWKRCGS